MGAVFKRYKRGKAQLKSSKRRMSHKHAPESLFANDEQLKGQKEALSKYLQLPDDATVERAVAALEEKQGADVHVVTKGEALEAALKAIPEGASISSAGSLSLIQIGFSEWAKTQTKYRDFKAESLAKYGTPEGEDLRRMGLAADVFFSSVTAISEEGELYAVDLTGTRTGGFITAKHLVVVAGTQKIVKNHQEVLDRTEKFCLTMESARVWDEYKIPGSAINYIVSLKGKNPMSPN